MQRPSDPGFWGVRLRSLAASLLFSVPTALLIWLGLNLELLSWGGFLGWEFLLVMIVFFGVLAVGFPKLFPSILAAVWRGMIRMAQFWF